MQGLLLHGLEDRRAVQVVRAPVLVSFFVYVCCEDGCVGL